MQDTIIKPNIKHLVISGGGPNMFQSIAAIQYLQENNIIDINTIESIYGSSAGSIVGVFICLKYDWETLNDYLIGRPWHELYHLKISHFFNAYKNRGLYTRVIFEKAFKPLFDAKDIPMTITLKEFYDYSKIELHFFTFEVNEFVTENISYLTHPELQLIDAIIMSSAIPVLFTPIINENKCYIDGGMFANYPLKFCIDSGKKEEEILGFCNKYQNTENRVNGDSNLLEFILFFIFKIFINLSSAIIIPKIKYEVHLNTYYLNYNFFKSTLYSMDVRKELYEKGKQSAKEFITSAFDKD